MIKILEGLPSQEYEKIKINIKDSPVLIEVASNRPLDVAIVTDAMLKAFEDSEEGDVEDIPWDESVHTLDKPFSPLTNQKYYLLLWNCNSRKDAIIAYKISKA